MQVCVVISVGTDRVIIERGKNFDVAIFSDYKCDKCQALHDGTTHWALPAHTTSSDLYHISRLQQCQTIWAENFMCSSD